MRRLVAQQLPAQQVRARKLPAQRVRAQQLPTQRHLLARQPLDPLMDVTHSLGFMNIAGSSPLSMISNIKLLSLQCHSLEKIGC